MEMKQTGGQGFKPLEAYGRNINQEVEANKIDPVIGREEEIRRVIEILSRKSKNNPVLIGEPGVGKTAIIEGLAQRIVHKDVPDNLLDKQIWELNLSSLISGASYQGQFEERLNQVVKEIKKSDGQIILFIDEIHQLVGMGKTSGAMDAANILKPMMARGEIKLIGATTLAEYRQYIEKDAALERRMTKVLVSEPTKHEALTIMRGLKEKWEMYHGVKIADSALVAAVELSERYISDRFLPDKAIDLIDEACAKVQTEMHSMPVELDQIKREIISLKTEQASLQNDKDPKSVERLQSITRQLVELSKKDKELSEVWAKEKIDNDKIIEFKTKIDEAKAKIERFQANGEYAKASELLYVVIPDLEAKKTEAEEKLKQNGNRMIKESVTALEVGEVIAKATGIPTNRIVESEKEKLLQLKQQLGRRVKGQDEALELVSDAVLRGRAGINDPQRPIGSFLFLGPTGVGKTEVAKALAENLFDTEKAMIRFDMSEYMEKHSVSKLIGAPPGYVGYEQAGALTEAVRRHPYSVILFDEIEKAHSDILNLFLQILDEGSLKDSQGRKINFKNTIIIMTSNVGAQQVLDGHKEKVMDEVSMYLKPELINRIDEIVIFNALDKNTVKKISGRLISDLATRLQEEGYDMEFQENILDIISDRAYDVQFGARPLKRWIQKNIENKMAEMIIAGEIKKNEKIKITFNTETNSIEIMH
ncbi:ATP-dependent Clp protease ATP-binding subunit [Ureaplasma ceti]|uniref:Chaperone protein ClpB n=1 Tax=Ureaplasma ceti TaxID=3119530 RepID=A0ABP9U9L2_9BACT